MGSSRWGGFQFFTFLQFCFLHFAWEGRGGGECVYDNAGRRQRQRHVTQIGRSAPKTPFRRCTEDADEDQYSSQGIRRTFFHALTQKLCNILSSLTKFCGDFFSQILDLDLQFRDSVRCRSTSVSQFCIFSSICCNICAEVSKMFFYRCNSVLYELRLILAEKQKNPILLRQT